MNKEIALTLSGGTARGYVFVGVYKVLEELGVKIVSVCGTSMGSIIGLFIASGYTASECYEYGKQMGIKDFADYDFLRFRFKGEKLRQLLVNICNNRNIEDLPVAYCALATELKGKQKLPLPICKGNAALASLASSSNPLFKRVMIGNTKCCDGYYVANCPTFIHSKLLQQRYENPPPHLAVDCMTNCQKNSFFDRLTTKLTIKQQAEIKLLQQKGENIGCDYLLGIDSHISQFRFDKYEQFVRIGEQATRDALPTLIPSLFGVTLQEFICAKS